MSVGATSCKGTRANRLSFKSGCGIFNSLVTKYSVWFTAFAGISIILAAVYTLNMIRKVFYGNTNELTASVQDLKLNEKLGLGIIVVLIFIFGVYPVLSLLH